MCGKVCVLAALQTGLKIKGHIRDTKIMRMPLENFRQYLTEKFSPQIGKYTYPGQCPDKL